MRLELNRDEPGDPTPDEKIPPGGRIPESGSTRGCSLRSTTKSLYAYHQVFDWEGGTYIRRGFLGRIRLERFGEGKVFPHEQTMSGPKADRLKLARSLPDEPVSDFRPVSRRRERRAGAARTGDHRESRRWKRPITWESSIGCGPCRITRVIEQVRGLLRDKPVFIADGHHRYETAINYRDGLQAAGKLAGPDSPPNFVMMMFVGMSDPGLVILPTHRLVSGVAALTEDDLTKRSGTEILHSKRSGRGPAAARETWGLIDADGGQDVLGLGTTRDGWWMLARLTDGSPMKTLAPDQSDDWRGLGVSLLHKLVVRTPAQGPHHAGGPKCRVRASGRAKSSRPRPPGKSRWRAWCRRRRSNTSRASPPGWKRCPPRARTSIPSCKPGWCLTRWSDCASSLVLGQGA